MEGKWSADDLRRAFVAGAAWKHWKLSGFTMFSSERDEAEDIAEIRYPGGRPPNQGVQLTAELAGSEPIAAESEDMRQPAAADARR
jgi:hypothetical protein